LPSIANASGTLTNTDFASAEIIMTARLSVVISGVALAIESALASIGLMWKQI
jgi:hypothetical protein